MYVGCVLSVLASEGCAVGESSPDPSDPSEVVLAPYECAPFEGVYRVVYAKRRGDCADLPEQLAHFDGREHASALNGSCEATITTSDDDCDREEHAKCPVLSDTGAAIGSATLVTAFTQTSEIRIEGSATIELRTIAGTGCTANYALIGSKVSE